MHVYCVKLFAQKSGRVISLTNLMSGVQSKKVYNILLVLDVILDVGVETEVNVSGQHSGGRDTRIMLISRMARSAHS